MKKIISIFLILFSMFNFISCKNEDKKEKSSSYNVSVSIEALKKANIVQENDFDKECEHEIIELIKGSEREEVKYFAKVRICPKCKGQEIIGYVSKEEAKKNINEVSNELKEAILNK